MNSRWHGDRARASASLFLTQLLLLWELRLRIALNRNGAVSGWLSVVAFLVSSLPSVILAITFFGLMRVPTVAQSQLWPDFILRLLCFVTTSICIAWPVLSAGVDDHSELSRYAAFPISGFRLMLASLVASVFEPRSLVIYGPLIGASLGYASTHPQAHLTLVAVSFAAYVILNAALARAGLHAVLNVLRQARSAELLGGGFVLTLVVASFIPPVDTSWLARLSEVGADAVPDTVIAEAVVALGRFPTGFFAHAMTFSARGNGVAVLADCVWLVQLAVLALVVAWGLLIAFHRNAGRGGGKMASSREANPFVATKTLWGTLVVREALDLWHNPRARLLTAVPFVLGILFKILSGRSLVVFLTSDTADAWLLVGLCSYGSMVLGSTFSQNAFGYDGQGFAAFLAAPVPLRAVLKAKNFVHAAAGGGLALAAGLFYRLYFGHGSSRDMLCAAAATLTLIPLLLTAGNFLSLYFPVKFHADLKRRDKLPLAASMLGVGAAAAGTAPMAFLLRHSAGRGPTWLTLAAGAGAALIAWGVYWVSWPRAAACLDRRREFVLRAVTRE